MAPCGVADTDVAVVVIEDAPSIGNGVYPTTDGTPHKERIACDYPLQAGQCVQYEVNASRCRSILH